jgi:hypothetical protein
MAFHPRRRAGRPAARRAGAARGRASARAARLYITERELFSPRHFLRDIVIAALAFAYSVWAIAGSGQEVIAKGFVLLLAGVPIYIGMRWWQQHATDRTAVELRPSQSNGKASTNGDVIAASAAAATEGIGHDA